MAGLIQRRTQVAIPDDPSYAISSDEWNDTLIVTGGTTGQVMTRDTAATDGWSLQTLNVTPAAGSITNAMLAGSITASKLIGTDLVLAQSQITNLTSDLATKAPLVAPAFTGSISVGTNPAQSGPIRLANNTSVFWRNGAGTADVGAVGFDATDNLTLVGNTAINFRIGGSLAWQLASANFYPIVNNVYDLGVAANMLRSGYFGTSISVGTNPATTGAIRLANNQTISARNAANTADIAVISLNASNQVVVAGGASKGAGPVSSITVVNGIVTAIS